MISSDKMNDKRKIDKFDNYILYTQRQTVATSGERSTSTQGGVGS